MPEAGTHAGLRARAPGRSHDGGRAPARRALAAGVVVAVAALSGGCARPGEGLRFTNDDRLRITAPEDGSEVDLPVTLRWTMEDFGTQTSRSGTSRNAGSFAVTVDRYPMGPRRPLSDLLPDGACGADPNCPTPDLLQTLADTYVTRKPSVTISSVPAAAVRGGSHYAVIVLVDAQGRRIGDSSWTVNFTVRDSGSTA